MADVTNTQGQGQTGTTTLEPEHHQTQAATGSPQAGGTSPGSQTATAATSTPGSTTVGASPGSANAGSSTSPWSPGSTSASTSSPPVLSRQEPALPSLGSLFGNPFGLMRNLVGDVDRFFDDFFGYGGGLGRGSSLPSGSRDLGRTTGQSLWYPQVEVRERDGKLVVCADLPGTRKEDVHVEIRDNALILQGERRQESEQREEGFYRSERSYGHFHRTIPLPEGVNPEQAQANFKDGVLEITVPLPQRQSPQGRRIEIT